MTVGIYRIYNKVMGRSYVGKSQNIEQRIKNHFSQLKNGLGTASHVKMYEDFQKYGLESFDYEILEECEPDQLDDREGYWAYQFKVFDPEKGYNTTWIDSYHKHAMQDPVYRAEYKRKIELSHYQAYLDFVAEKRSDNPADPRIMYRYMYDLNAYRDHRFVELMLLIEKFLLENGYSSPLRPEVLEEIPALVEEFKRQEEVLRQIEAKIRQKLKESVGLNSDDQ